MMAYENHVLKLLGVEDCGAAVIDEGVTVHHITIAIDLSTSTFRCANNYLLSKQVETKLRLVLNSLVLSARESSADLVALTRLVTLVVSFSQISHASSHSLCQCVPLSTSDDVDLILNFFSNFWKRLDFLLPIDTFGICASEVAYSLIFRYGIMCSLLAPTNSLKKLVVLSDFASSLSLARVDEFSKLFNVNEISCYFILLHSSNGSSKSYLDNFGFVSDTSLPKMLAFNTNGAFISELGATHSQNHYQNEELCRLFNSFNNNSTLVSLNPDSPLRRKTVYGIIRQRFIVVNFENTSLISYVISRIRDGFRLRMFHKLNNEDQTNKSVCLQLAVRDDCIIELNVKFEEVISQCQNFTVSIYLEGAYTYIHDLFMVDGKCEYPNCTLGLHCMGTENRFKATESTMKLLSLAMNKLEPKVKYDIKRFVKYISSEDLSESVAQGTQLFKTQYDPSGYKTSVPNDHENVDIYEYIGLWSFIYSLDLNTWQKRFNVHKFVYTMRPDTLPDDLFSMTGTPATTRSRKALKEIHERIKQFAKVVIQELFWYASFIQDAKNHKHLFLVRINTDIQTVFTHCFVVYLAFPFEVPYEDRIECIKQFEETMLLGAKMDDTNCCDVSAAVVDNNAKVVVTLFSKSIDRLSIRYDQCPEDLNIVLPSRLEKKSKKVEANDYQNRVSLNVYSTLSRFYYHRRWVKSVPNIITPRYGATFQNDSVASNISPASGETESNCFEKVMTRIVECRLNEGFHMIYGTQGVVLLLKELIVKVCEGVESTVILQYVCFKPRICRSTGQVLISTECWIEPHCGNIQADFLTSANDEKEINCYSYEDLVQKIEEKDELILCNSLNFLFCRELINNDNIDIQNFKLPDSPKTSQSECSDEDRREFMRTLCETNFHFDALQLCSYSKLFTIDVKSFSINTDGGGLNNDPRNSLLLETIHANLEKAAQISSYISNYGSQKLATILSKRSERFKKLLMANNQNSSARVFNKGRCNSDYRGMSKDTLIADAPTREVPSNPNDKDGDNSNTSVPVCVSWVFYMISLVPDNLFYIIVPYQLEDVHALNCDMVSQERQLGHRGMSFDIPFLIFENSYNELWCENLSEERVPSESESSATVVSSLSVERHGQTHASFPQLKSHKLKPVLAISQLIQEVYHHSYVRSLYYLMALNSKSAVTTKAEDLFQTSPQNLCSELELKNLCVILDTYNEISTPYNIMPMLFLNCGHIASPEDETVDDKEDGEHSVFSELRLASYEGPIDCKDMTYKYTKQISLFQTFVSPMSSQCHKSAANTLQEAIENDFNSILNDFYTPLFNSKASSVESCNEGTTTFLWKQFESLNVLSPSDYRTIRFGDPGEGEVVEDSSLNACNEYSPEMLPEPLFLRMYCSVRFNKQQFCEIPVCNLPTCLKEIFAKLYGQVMNTELSDRSDHICSDTDASWLRAVGMPEIIENLEATIIFRFLYLPHIESLKKSLEDFVIRRSRATSSTHECPNDWVIEANIENNDNLPYHIPKQTEFLENMQWFLRDVVATNLHDSVCSKALDLRLQHKMKNHVEQYASSEHGNSSFREMDLKFVEPNMISFELLLKELASFSFSKFKVRKVSSAAAESEQVDSSLYMYGFYVDHNVTAVSSKGANEDNLAGGKDDVDKLVSRRNSDNTSDCGSCPTSRLQNDYNVCKHGNSEVSSQNGGAMMGFQSPFMKEFEDCIERDNLDAGDTGLAEEDDKERTLVSKNVNSETSNWTIECGEDPEKGNSNSVEIAAAASLDQDEFLYDERSCKKSSEDSFWMMFELDAKESKKAFTCRLYFHKSFRNEYDVASDPIDELFREFEIFVNRSVHKVNQIRLLDHFYTYEQCLPILYNCTDFYNEYQDSFLDWRELADTNEFEAWNVDEFKCDELKRLLIPIHVRIQPERPKAGSRVVSEAVTSVFERWGIKTARMPTSLSLYKTKLGDVFYIKCAIDDQRPSSSFLRKTMKKTESTSSLSRIDPNTAGKPTSMAAASSHHHRSYLSTATKYKVVVSIFGVGQLDDFLNEQLQKHIEKSLYEKTIYQLWASLINGQCKLYDADVCLLQPNNSATNVYLFEIPIEFKAHMYHVMFHLKTNLSLYSVEPKYWNNEQHDFHFKGSRGETCQTVNCLLYIDKCSPHVSRGPTAAHRFKSDAAAGITLIEFSVKCPSTSTSGQTQNSPMYTQIINYFNFPADKLPQCTLVESVNSSNSGYYVQFCTWETGKVNREKLLKNVLESCLNQALCDVYAGYQLLDRAPSHSDQTYAHYYLSRQQQQQSVGVQSDSDIEINLNASLPSHHFMTHQQQHSTKNHNNTIEHYFNTVYPWLFNVEAFTNCLSIVKHTCVLNFRQRFSEFFYSLKPDKPKDFHWMLFRNVSGQLFKLRDQTLTKPLNQCELAFDYSEPVLRPQVDQPDYYFIAYNPADWTTLTAPRSRHASGNSETTLSSCRQVVHVPKNVSQDMVFRRGIIIGKFQNRRLSSVAYNISDSSTLSLFDKFDAKAKSMNGDSRILNCIVRQKMGLFDHKCFPDFSKRSNSGQRLQQFTDKFKEHRVRIDNKFDKCVDQLFKKQPNFYTKLSPQDRSVYSSSNSSTVPEVKQLFVESLKQLAHTYEYQKSKESVRVYLEKFEDAVTEPKIDALRVNAEELELIMSRSRLYHYVTTPMFFAPSWQKLTSNGSLRTETTEDAIAGYVKRKQEVIELFSKRFDRIRLDVTNTTSRYKNLNSSSHPNNVRFLFPNSSNSETAATVNLNKSQNDFTRYMVLWVNYGGVAVLKFGFYISEYDCFFCVQLNTFLFRKGGAANSFELFDVFYQKLDFLVESLHVHSFAYELQLEMLWTYLLEKSDPNMSYLTYPELEANQRNILNFLTDLIRSHQGKAPANSIKRIVTKQLTVSLGVGDEINRMEFYEYLVERKDIYGIECITIPPGSRGCTGLESTTVIVKNYRIDAPKIANLRKPLNEISWNCSVLIAHENVFKTEHRHRKNQLGIDQFCCLSPTTEKPGEENKVVLRYFLLLSCEMTAALRPTDGFDKFKFSLRSEERRSFLENESKTSQSLNNILLEQDKECVDQIRRVMERVKKDFRRDSLLNKLVQHSPLEKKTSTISMAVAAAESLSSTNTLFGVGVGGIYSHQSNSAAATSKKKSSTCSSSNTATNMLRSNISFNSCLNERETELLVKFFNPVLISSYLEGLESTVSEQEVSESKFESPSVISSPSGYFSSSFSLKFGELIDLIMPKIDDFLMAVARIAYVNILNLSPTGSTSNQPRVDHGGHYVDNWSGVGEGLCALIFRKPAVSSDQGRFSVLAVPQFMVLLSTRGALPQSILMKLNHANKQTTTSSSSNSTTKQFTISPRMVIVSTAAPSRMTGANNPLYCSDNVQLIKDLYNFMLYFSYLT